MSQESGALGPVLTSNQQQLTNFEHEQGNNKTRFWYARKYLVLDGESPTKQTLQYRELSVWEHITALVGFGPTLDLTDIAGFCAKNRLDDACLKAKYERFLNKRIERLGDISGPKIEEVVRLFTFFKADQLTDASKAKLVTLIESVTGQALRGLVKQFQEKAKGEDLLAIVRASTSAQKDKIAKKISKFLRQVRFSIPPKDSVSHRSAAHVNGQAQAALLAGRGGQEASSARTSSDVPSGAASDAVSLPRGNGKLAIFDSLTKDSSRLAFLQAMVKKDEQDAFIRQLAGREDKSVLLRLLRPAIAAHEMNIASALFTGMPSEQKYSFLKEEVRSAMQGGRQSVADFERLINTLSKQERERFFTRAIQESDVRTAILLLADAPEEEQIRRVLSLSPTQQMEMITLATPSQLLHFLQGAPSDSPMQRRIIERFTRGPVEDCMIACSKFTAEQIYKMLARFPKDRTIINMFLGKIASAMMPEARCDLFCRLPPSFPFDKMQLVEGLSLPHLPEGLQRMVKGILYAEFQRAYEDRNVPHILRVLELLPWQRELHLQMLDRAISMAMSGRGTEMFSAIVNMISTKVLVQDDIGPLVGPLSGLVRSSNLGDCQLAYQLSRALKMKRIEDPRLRQAVEELYQQALALVINHAPTDMIVNMISTNTLTQDDFAPVVQRIGELVARSDQGDSQIAYQLSRALKAKRIVDPDLRRRIEAVVQTAKEKNGPMNDVATNLEQCLQVR